MNFITEKISEEDKQRIGFDKLTEHMGWRPRPSTWTVDREEESFLIHAFWGNEDDRNGCEYVFFWKGYAAHIAGESDVAKTDDGLIFFWKLRGKPQLPVELESLRGAMYLAFERAISQDVQGNGRPYARIEFTMI